MGRPVKKIEGYNASDIKALIRKDERYTIGIRLYAVYQVALGMPSRKLEELYQTSFKQILNWVHRFELDGLDGLRDKEGRGRKSALSVEQLKAISDLVGSHSPTDHGYNTDTWTGPLVIDWIKQKYNIEYKKAHIYNIMKKLGFTYQKAKGFYPEADPQAQEAFKEDLKKNFRKVLLILYYYLKMSFRSQILLQWATSGVIKACNLKLSASKRVDKDRQALAVIILELVK
jgi:transposase